VSAVAPAVGKTARTREASTAYDLNAQSMRGTSSIEHADSKRTSQRRFRRTGVVAGSAQTAATRAFAVTVTYGALALASALFVVTRLLERWRLDRVNAHMVSVFGQRLSYPAANAGAIVVSALAALGLVVLVAAARAGVREVRADRRFRRSTRHRESATGHRAVIIDSDRPQAFCAGLVHPRVYLSRGALELLSAGELSAVLAHERHHARRRDPLRLACARALADALFFLPPLRRLVEQQNSLSEMAADDAAVIAAAGDRAALASAMLRFSESSDAGASGIAPERVDHLVEEGVGWRFPVALVLVVGFCLAALVLTAVLTAEAASGSASLAAPLVSSQPCVVMLALIPAAVVWAGVRGTRARAPRSRVATRAADSQV
jgi:Zn-dependent protease with chaperone function